MLNSSTKAKYKIYKTSGTGMMPDVSFISVVQKSVSTALPTCRFHLH
ncbi:hypothetical protein BH11BAC3_BH11BAC3_45390 [soil metagenome]